LLRGFAGSSSSCGLARATRVVFDLLGLSRRKKLELQQAGGGGPDPQRCIRLCDYPSRTFVAASGLMSYPGSAREAYYLSARRLYRADSQMREARRPASPADHQSRIERQSQDWQGAGPRNPLTLLARTDEVIE